MHLLALIIFSLNTIPIVLCQELSVTRHPDGDIFTVEGSCTEACAIFSSGTAGLYSFAPPTGGVPVLNSSCTCQCSHGLPVFRDDLNICVDDIQESKVAGFVSNSGLVERVPYVFLPQRGQIIYPHAEIRFEGVKIPVCGIAGAQQLGRGGWSELRNLSDAEPPFKLFRDEGRTFLQWNGESGLRNAAEGRVVIVKLVCRDEALESVVPGVFTLSVAFRVAGSPAKNNVREVMFTASPQPSQGLSTAEYTAIGFSSVILALIYVASVSLYIYSRKAKRKRAEEPEAALAGGRDGNGLVKNNPLLGTSRHFESDTNSGLSESDLGDDLPHSDAEQVFENVVSAVVHPHCAYMETEGIFGSGSIISERLPEEDVRIVETVENAYQQDQSSLPGSQRRKLYFNPAYFDRQLLLAPPPAAVEFLLKIREVISIAKHKMAAKKFVPTLLGIPEEETTSERMNIVSQQRAHSVQGYVSRSRKTQGCTGCPGCRESLPNFSATPSQGHPCPGESRIRAWLEDVKPPEKRWKDADDSKRNFAENARSFSRNLEYLKEMAKHDFLHPEKSNIGKTSMAAWKENPPMLKTFQNIASSECMENDDNVSISKRSTRSMFEESNYNRYCNARRAGIGVLEMNNTINAKVRKAIENSFIKQMEENAALECLENKLSSAKENMRALTNSDESAVSSLESSGNTTCKKSKKGRAPSAPKKLPDMINELPKAKIPTKRIMDAVIREMVDVKALEHHSRTAQIIDYEVDSLERSKSSQKSSSISPELHDQSSPTLSTALPMDEELTMQNAIFNTKTGEMTLSRMKRGELDEYYNLPELVSQRSQGYSLVSEVYVNDGYVSPAGSDSSGPEIQYEPENPGHLTIKVQDSPENYVQQDDSEYEPDTLDRKPMKLKINGDVNYDKGTFNEVYVDSLERPAQILLRSKGSFRDDSSIETGVAPLQRGYGSLREIYEAKVRSNLKDSKLVGSTRSLNGDPDHNNTLSWRKNKYLTPDMKQARRQRQQNQPDVVPMPPTEGIYQIPKPPRKVENLISKPPLPLPKNAWDRSRAKAGDPTAGEATPVLRNGYSVGKLNIMDNRHQHRRFSQQMNLSEDLVSISNDVGSTCQYHNNGNTGYSNSLDNISRRSLFKDAENGRLKHEKHCSEHSTLILKPAKNKNPSVSSGISCNGKSSSVNRSYSEPRILTVVPKSHSSIWNHRDLPSDQKCLISDGCVRVLSTSEQDLSKCLRLSSIFHQHSSLEKLPSSSHSHLQGSCSTQFLQRNTFPNPACRVEDSGYLSSTDSNGSHKQLLKHEVSSVSETDETESVFDGASESGAESIGTDSVFFGNFRKLSEMSRFSLSVDSGVDVNVRNPYFQAFGIRNEGGVLERMTCNASDSEAESLVTVLPPGGSQRNSLVL